MRDDRRPATATAHTSRDGQEYYFCSSSATRKPGEPDHGGDPRRILDERLARGEINTAEYQRLSDLIAHGGQAPSGSGSGR